MTDETIIMLHRRNVFRAEAAQAKADERLRRELVRDNAAYLMPKRDPRQDQLNRVEGMLAVCLHRLAVLEARGRL